MKYLNLDEKKVLKENIENRFDILLSTYNGSKFLRPLLDSILNQTNKSWRLLIRDDGSTDNTIDIIEKYTKQFPEKIFFISDHYQNLGPSQSFSKLMKYCDGDYIMFCDQDDIWLENKVELTIKEMKRLEKENPNKPLLVHTNLTVVNKDLQVISKSFWKYQKLNPTYKNLNNLLIQNIVTGCTMMINKRLKDLVFSIPKSAIMHDWWIALVASIFNGIYHIDNSTILYRQHDQNNVGAKQYSLEYLLTSYGPANDSIKSIIKQGECFKRSFNEKLNKNQIKLLDSFIQILDNHRIDRLLKALFTYRFRKHGILRNIGFIITLLLYKKE